VETPEKTTTGPDNPGDDIMDNVANFLPYSERPTPHQEASLDQIDIAITNILDAVGVAYTIDDAETEHGFADWYAGSENKCTRQLGVVWETGARSLLVVSVFFWDPFVTVSLYEYEKSTGRCRAYGSSSDVSIRRETADAFAAKLRSIAA